MSSSASESDGSSVSSDPTSSESEESTTISVTSSDLSSSEPSTDSVTSASETSEASSEGEDTASFEDSEEEEEEEEEDSDEESDEGSDEESESSYGEGGQNGGMNDVSVQQMSQYVAKHKSKSVREIVAARTGKTLEFDEAWRTSQAIEGIHVESMAAKRWKWAVTQVLEQQAAAKEAQRRWTEVASVTKKKKFSARGSHLVLFVCFCLEALFLLLLLSIDDVRKEEGQVYDSEQIQLVISVQLFTAALLFLYSVYMIMHLFKKLHFDPKLANSPVLDMMVFKVVAIAGYVCLMGYPTVMRAAFLSILVVLGAMDVFLLGYILWAYQFSILMKHSVRLPSVLRALLSLRQHMSTHHSPMTVGLVENLLQWLSRNKAKKTVMPGPSSFTMIGTVVLFLVTSMTLVGLVTVRTFQLQILPDETMIRIADECDPLTSSVLGEEYFWKDTGRLDHSPDGTEVSRKLYYFVVTGARHDIFEDLLMYLRQETIEDSVLFKMRTQVPSTSLPNWLNLLTGVGSEVTGYMGDTTPKKSYFNTIFTQAKDMGLKRGAAVSTWFAPFLQHDMEAFEGSAFVGPDYNTDETKETVDQAQIFDEVRHKVMMSTFDEVLPYDLFMTHYIQPNTAAMKSGVPVDIRDSSSYLESMINIMYRVQEVVDMVDDNTIVMVVGDHGHISGPLGGYGGVGDDVLDVPLFVYKRGWGQTATKPVPADAEGISSLDVPCTISMLLGIPTPRHNQGKFIEALKPLVYSDAYLKRHYEDLLTQTRTFLRYLTQLYSGGDSKHDDEIDSYLLNARGNSTMANYLVQYDDMREYTNTQREWYKYSVSLRNVMVSFVFFLLFAGGMIFVMQVMTLADPFAVFSAKIGTKGYAQNADCRAFYQAAAICLLHYGLSYGMLNVGFGIYGYSIKDSTVLSSDSLLTLYIVGAIAPSAVISYVLLNTVMSKYHQLETGKFIKENKSLFGKFPIFKKLFSRFYRGKVFKNFEMAYLSRTYALLLSALFSLMFVMAFCEYIFIVPFVFANPFIDEDTWGTRWRNLTMLLVSLPMLLQSIWYAFQWQNQKLTPDSYHSFEDMRQHKEMRMREMTGAKGMSMARTEEEVYLSKALQAGGRFAGLGRVRRPHITAEMFDTVEDEIAEIQAEIHVLRRQIEEMDTRYSLVQQEEKATRQRLQESNDKVSANMEMLFNQLREGAPPEHLPMDKYRDIKAKVAETEADLKEVENMVLEQIKLKRSNINTMEVNPATAEKYQNLFGDQFDLNTMSAMMDARRPEMAAHAKYLDVYKRHEEGQGEKEKLKARISFYEKHFATVKDRREEELEQLNDVFEEVLHSNEKLKNQIVTMIGERNGLLLTLKSLKKRRVEVTQNYKTEMFHMESKEEHLKEEFGLLNDEFELIEQEKEVLFREVAFVAAELHTEEEKLRTGRAEVEKYRKTLSKML